VIQLPVARCVPQVIDQLKDVLNAYPGTTEVRLKLLNGSRTTVMRIDDTLRVSPSTALYGDLKALLGPGCLA
jgi:DNA polymerase-3 subunit alpha